MALEVAYILARPANELWGTAAFYPLGRVGE